jgi:hypothetical protein
MSSKAVTQTGASVMIKVQQNQSIVPLLKPYNTCLIFTIITIQAALSFVILFFTSTNVLLSWVLVSCVLVFHLLGVSCFHLSLNNLGVKRPRMIGLYLLVPFGNVLSVVWLLRMVQVKQAEDNSRDLEPRLLNAAEIKERLDSFINRI